MHYHFLQRYTKLLTRNTSRRPVSTTAITKNAESTLGGCLLLSGSSLLSGCYFCLASVKPTASASEHTMLMKPRALASSSSATPSYRQVQCVDYNEPVVRQSLLHLVAKAGARSSDSHGLTAQARLAVKRMYSDVARHHQT